jgi:hypothetical protein
MPSPNYCHQCTNTERDLLALVIEVARDIRTAPPGNIRKYETWVLRKLTKILRGIRK